MYLYLMWSVKCAKLTNPDCVLFTHVSGWLGKKEDLPNVMVSVVVLYKPLTQQ